MTRFPRAQQGAALFVSLILLLVLTITAVSSMQGTLLQEKMVSAQRDGQIAFEGAEHALREAEALLRGATLPDFDNTDGLYDEDGDAPVGAELFAAATWDGDATTAASMPQSGGKNLLAEAPRYFIQRLDPASLTLNTQLDLNVENYSNSDGEAKVHAYRIVARSTGTSGQAPRIVEEYFVREQ